MTQIPLLKDEHALIMPQYIMIASYRKRAFKYSGSDSAFQLVGKAKFPFKKILKQEVISSAKTGSICLSEEPHSSTEAKCPSLESICMEIKDEKNKTKNKWLISVNDMKEDISQLKKDNKELLDKLRINKEFMDKVNLGTKDLTKKLTTLTSENEQLNNKLITLNTIYMQMSQAILSMSEKDHQENEMGNLYKN